MSGNNKYFGVERAIYKHKLLTEEQLDLAIKESKDLNVDIISHIVNQKLVGQRELAMGIAQQMGLKFFDLAKDFDEHALPKNLVDDTKVIQTRVLPLYVLGEKMYVAIANPAQIKFVQQVCFASQLKPEVVIAEVTRINEIIETNFGQFTDVRAVSTEDLLKSLSGGGDPEDAEAEPDTTSISLADSDSNAPIVSYINKTLLDAIRMKASDLHFEPFEKEYRIRFRVDGILRHIETLPGVVATRFSSRLKVMSGMDISEKRAPQDGRVRLKISETKAIDFRVNSLPTAYGEKIVLRILDPSSAKMGIDSLGYEPEQKALFMEALEKPQGMILITGPTGSGKTVSLYTGLNILNRMDCNISTAEDPIEINLNGINQVAVNSKSGMTFSAALRAFLRQDPDIIMVGEIRDLETAEIAIKAAQTGHMVMSTLHTNSAPETLTRLRNMGVPSFNVATSVNLVIAQRLARKLCSTCRKEADIPRQSLLQIGFTEAEIDAGLKIYEPVGCGTCSDGYKGRVGVYEVMKVTPDISKIIMEEGNAIEIAEASTKAGFPNLRASGLKKVKDGLTSIQEIMRITSE